jgi:hypothetical protein
MCLCPDPWEIFFSYSTCVNNYTSSGPQHSFDGAGPDFGALMAVIGLYQALAHCCEYRIQFEPNNSPTIFIFGDQECSSFGKLNILVPCPDMGLKISAIIVHPSVPLLLGTDKMNKHEMNVLSVKYKLRSVHAGWLLPYVRQQGCRKAKIYRPLPGSLSGRPLI